MNRKFSELTASEQNRFTDLVKFMSNEDIGVKINIIQRFNLDITDPVVLDFLTGVYTSTPPQSSQNSLDGLEPISTVGLQKPLPTNNEQSLLLNTTETTKTVETTKKREMTYANSEDLIVIQNRLLHAISNLTLNERRLILFLSPIVRKETSLNAGKQVFFVRVSDFSKEYNLKGKNMYYELEKATNEIQHKVIEFWDYNTNSRKQKRKTPTRVSWVTKSVYFEGEAEISVELHKDVIEMLTVFDKTTGNFWTQYQKEWVVNLGAYGIIMLELVLSSIDKEVKGYYTIEHLREKFNCVDSYIRFSDFKLYVIDKSIKEIGKHTPIKIKYDIHKRGRIVNGLSFSYTDNNVKTLKDKTKNNNNETNEVNPFINFKMTQKQLSLFASKIKKASGQDVEEIIAELSNVHLQSKHIDFLKVLDYVPSDWYSDDEIKSHLTAEQIAQAQADKKAQAKVQEQQRQEQFRADMNKLVAHAETFVKANLSKVGKAGIERIYLQQENYVGIVRAWERHLLDEKTRKHFAMLDELLVK